MYSKWLPLFQGVFHISNPGTGGHFCKNNSVTVSVPSSSVSPLTTPHVLSELIGASSSLRHHLQNIHKPLGTAEASRRLRCNKMLLSVLARLSVLPPMAAGLSREEQAQEGSFSAFAVILDVQHHKVFAEHVCIANAKHVKGFLLIFLVQGVHEGSCVKFCHDSKVGVCHFTDYILTLENNYLPPKTCSEFVENFSKKENYYPWADNQRGRCHCMQSALTKAARNY